MKKLFKKLMIVVIVVPLFTIQFNIIYPLANMKNIAQNNFRAWPGRPGGNGDGSEEYMNGLKYGEMRGPWKLSYSHSGRVIDLINDNSLTTGIGHGIVGTVFGVLMGGSILWGVVTTIALNASSHLNGLTEEYEGAVFYTIRAYGSGRRVKIITEFRDKRNVFLNSTSKEFGY